MDHTTRIIRINKYKGKIQITHVKLVDGNDNFKLIVEITIFFFFSYDSI